MSRVKIARSFQCAYSRHVFFCNCLIRRLLNSQTDSREWCFLHGDIVLVSTLNDSLWCGFHECDMILCTGDDGALYSFRHFHWRYIDVHCIYCTAHTHTHTENCLVFIYSQHSPMKVLQIAYCFQLLNFHVLHFFFHNVLLQFFLHNCIFFFFGSFPIERPTSYITSIVKATCARDNFAISWRTPFLLNVASNRWNHNWGLSL